MSKTSSEQQDQLNQLRSIIIGKKEPRQMVSDVVVEALHDREKKDGSVNRILQPIVEESVRHSVTHHSDRLVSSLYPLMGNLVRKYVTAFLADFLEKTNQLIENSLTIKGLKWRIKARQSGMGFAQYVASRTFVFRVEHVFLIHRETGLLLNAVDLHPAGDGSSNADLISSMLSAINDFVGDSFFENEDGLREQLQSVSTDNFKLLIKPGPSAIIVAAVTGNPSQHVSDQLQLTLEEVHSLYSDDLSSYEGDNKAFIATDNILRDCLLTKQREDGNSSSGAYAKGKKRKMPWFSIAIVFALLGLFIYKSVESYQESKLATRLMALDELPGVIVKTIEVNDKQDINIDVFRDPDAFSVEQWLIDRSFQPEHFNIRERLIVSKDPLLNRTKALRVLEAFPSIEVTWQSDQLILLGQIDFYQRQSLFEQLSSIGYVEGKNLIHRLAPPINVNELTDDPSVQQALFSNLVGRISAIQLNFPISQSELSPDLKETLAELYIHISQLNSIASTLNLDFGLIIMGTSDSSGNKTVNDKLSLKRANNAADYLHSLGLNKQNIYVTGLGQIDINTVKNTSRKVLFNVIHVRKNNKGQ